MADSISAITCTGITATWCPIHGDCDCPRDPIHGEINFDVGEFSCPLHAWNSPHGDVDSGRSAPRSEADPGA